ncbi:MAG: hypothetical protein ABIB61_00725 [Candidatus Shapirobacteria bacterium]
MKIKKKKIVKIGSFALLPLLLATFYLLLQPSQAGAAQLIKLTAIPPRLEISANPGDVVVDQLKVRNEGDSQLGIELKIQDFIVNDKEGTPLPVEEGLADQYAASLWITVSPQKFLLNPGETKVLDFVAVVPEDAAPGGHYAVIFYAPAGESLEANESVSSIEPNVGSLIYLTIAGDTKEDARVSLFSTPKFQEYGPVNIDTEIYNLSDIHIRPMGSIKITNWLGQHNQTLKLEEQNIFPTTIRAFENIWNQKWGFGKYKVQLEAGYGNQGKTLIATTFFWIIPWRAMTIALLIIVLIVLLIIYFKKPKELKAEAKS